MLDALEAKLATYPDGTYTVTIRFADAAVAAASLMAEHRSTPVPLTRVAGRERMLIETPDFTTFQFQDGAQVVRVTGANRAAVEQRLAGSPPGANLRQRLLAVARAAVPFTVRPGDRPDELVAEWRYADATWLDQMRAHRMTQLIRYRLRLDQGDRTVRVREYRSQFDASAGSGGVRLSYRVQFGGITFFDTQRYTVLGLQIKDGRITPDLSYIWRFNLEELRNPLASDRHRWVEKWTDRRIKDLIQPGLLDALPREKDGLTRLEQILSVEHVARWRSTLKETLVEVLLRKFRMTCAFRLDQALAALGMVDAFSLSKADFSGMDGRPGWLLISAVLQKTYLDVSEAGTEAGAATPVLMAPTAAPGRPPVFRADHPFWFAISEARSGAVLFLGRVTDPTKPGR